MALLNTDHLETCIKTLESSLMRLQSAQPDSIDYEIFRNATIKGFELTLETSEKLLRKALKTYSGDPKAIDQLTYKDIFRHAVKHDLLTPEDAKHWFAYRDNRNDTAHDYGIEFANSTVRLLPDFINDAKKLLDTLHHQPE